MRKILTGVLISSIIVGVLLLIGERTLEVNRIKEIEKNIGVSEILSNGALVRPDCYFPADHRNSSKVSCSALLYEIQEEEKQEIINILGEYRDDISDENDSITFQGQGYSWRAQLWKEDESIYKIYIQDLR